MRNFFTIALSLISLWSFAQTDVHPCGQVSQTEKFLEDHPELVDDVLRAEDELNDYTLEYIQNHDASERGTVYYIPLVFHVIHEGGVENISDAQIENAIEILNRDFRLLNADASNANSAFVGIQSDIEIEFRLAQRDPNGECTRGINRIYSSLTNEGDDNMKALSNWPRNKYLNVWVCKDAGGAAGYTFKPSAVSGNWGSQRDGIVLLHNYTGAIGTSSPNRSRTLTHEVGHWINLDHCWGPTNNPGLESNCGVDDFVNDTPNSLGWTSCNTSGESCGSLDNVENYMEYSYCSKMFTQGQSSRMRASITSSIAQRNELITSANHIATGILQDEELLCAVSFNADRQVVCVGEEIEFSDESFHGINQWSWNFGDETVLSGDDPEVYQSPSHSYEQPGIYSVSLTAGNGFNQQELTKDDFIYVLDSSELEMPFFHGFETDEPTDRWFVQDDDGDQKWVESTSAAYTGSRSMRLRNFNTNQFGTKDAFQSSTFDMSGFDAVYISYKWAFATRTTETDDRLRVYISPNCGNSWILKKLHRGFNDLPTAPSHNNQFVPNGPGEWSENEIVIDANSQLVDAFRVQFEFESYGGNNIYIDDINIIGLTTTDLEELAQKGLVGLQVYPNPASSEVTVAFDLVTNDRVDLILRDMTGREVQRDFGANLPAGNHNKQVNVSNLSPGVYLMEFVTSKARQTKRMVVR